MILVPTAESLLANRYHRLAYCWQIIRTDGISFAFTDHDHELNISGLVYTPTGGFSSSAKQRQTGLKDNNFEVVGIFDSAAITYDDLRAGRYREAKVIETLVDWQYPWVSPFSYNVYWIANTRFIDERWEAELRGFSLWLEKPVGDIAERNCPYTVGDAKCTLNLAPFTFAGTVLAIVNGQIKFTASGAVTGKGDGYFDSGKLTWTTGPNVGFVSEVRKYLNSGATFSLQIQTPYAIAPGDQFSAIAGDDYTPATCKAKFNNFVNFGGRDQIPGNDQMLRTPKIKGSING